MRHLAAVFALMLVACSATPSSSAPDAPADTPSADVAPDASTPDAPAVVDATDAVADLEVAVDVASEASADAAPDAPPTCVDRDGDGYGAGCARGPDCDDADAQRHPGATERCNGLDDDCDGTGDVARSDALDAWCTTLWRTAYTRSNLDPMRDHAYCYIPPMPPRVAEPRCFPTRVACGAEAYHPYSACICFTSADENFACQ